MVVSYVTYKESRTAVRSYSRPETEKNKKIEMLRVSNAAKSTDVVWLQYTEQWKTVPGLIVTSLTQKFFVQKSGKAFIESLKKERNE